MGEIDTITQMVEALVKFDLNLTIYVRKTTENVVKLLNEDIYGNVHTGPIRYKGSCLVYYFDVA